MTPRSSQNRGDKGWVLDAGALVLVFWILAWTLAKINTPLSPPPLPGERWGNTSFSDFLTLMAGHRFHDGGYLNNYFLDNMTVGFKEFSRGWYAYQVPLSVPNSAIYYTHYGSIDGIVNGLLRGFGLTDLLIFYKVAAALSCGSLVLWYASASLLYGRVVGLISLFFVGTSLVFLRLAETIAAYSYDFLFAFGACVLFVIANRPALSTGRTRLALAGSWVLTFLQASNTPEFVLWLQIFFLGYLWAGRDGARPAGFQAPAPDTSPVRRLTASHRGTVRIALAMVLAPVAAWCAHFLQMAWVLGGAANAVSDLGDALSRRTTGFSLATETPFRNFRLDQAMSFINGQLMTMLHFSLVSAAVLLVVAWWGTSQVLRTAPEGERSVFSARWNLILVLFLAGLAFWVVFPQATITATEITLRLFLPFAGVLIGHTVVLLWKVLRQHHPALVPKIVALGAVTIVVVPVVQDRLTGRATDINLHVAAPAYTGRTTNEIRILTSFVKSKTRYGDIILTPIDVGDTGHPRYPHPAYEYLSQRRFEVVSNIDGLVRALDGFEKIRQHLPSSNPANRVSHYLLLDDTRDFPQFRSFVACSREPQITASTHEWWIDHRGGVPVLPGGRKERDVVFSLFLLKLANAAACSDDAVSRATNERNVRRLHPSSQAARSLNNRALDR